MGSRKAKAMEEIEFGAKYAFLMGKDEPTLYGYDIVIMGRKLVLVVLVCAFRSPLVKAILVAFVLQAVVAFALLMRHRPYVEIYHNILDNLTLLASIILLWGGTITSNRLLRDIVVIAALMAILVIVTGGVLYEFWRIKSRDKEIADEVFEEQGIEASIEMSDFDDPADQDVGFFTSIDLGNTHDNFAPIQHQHSFGAGDELAFEVTNPVFAAADTAALPEPIGTPEAYPGGASLRVTHSAPAFDSFAEETSGVDSWGPPVGTSFVASSELSSSVFLPPPPIPAAATGHQGHQASQLPPPPPP